MKGFGYEELVVWQKSMDLCTLIYTTTNMFPREEQFGLTSQMRRSAVSVPSNIAEGRNRSSRKDFRNFLHIAKGSAAELCTQVEIARRLGYINNKTATELTDKLQEVMKLLGSFIVSLKD